jgi:hypothetical protein
LRVTGPNKAPAEVGFHPTLTFITGLSNTGKSHIFKCIDFALGATTPQHHFPESRGYDRVLLEVASGKKVVTIGRSFGRDDTARVVRGRDGRLGRSRGAGAARQGRPDAAARDT